MTKFEDQLLADLMRQYRPALRGIQRPAATGRMMLRARPAAGRTRGLLLVVAAWAITAVLGLVIASTVTGSGPTSAGSARHTGRLPGPGWNGNRYPLGAPGPAEKTTVAGAQAAVGFPVPVPSDPAASQASLTQAWVSTHGRQVALVFDDGRVDITMAPAQYQNPLRQFRTFIAENQVTAAIGQVNGQPALVITPGTDASRSNPAYVEFDRDGIDINIWSNTYRTDTLLAIASSMQ
jgi:hypothetical protein